MGANVAPLQCCAPQEDELGQTETLPSIDFLMDEKSNMDGNTSQDRCEDAIAPSPRLAAGAETLKLAKLFASDLAELSATRTLAKATTVETRPIYHFRSGATYKGQWRGTARHGFGVQRWPDGTRYEGQWVDNKAEGRGRITLANGDRYTGEWRANAFHGLGAYRARDGTMYFGDWHEDQRVGHGLEVVAGGVKYAGEFRDGSKEGRGLCVWPDGGQYSGDWAADQITGLGVHRNAKGGVFRGGWRAAARHGIGCHVWSDGRCYMGTYQDGREVGFGCYLDQTGLQYTVGRWTQGRFHRQAPHTTDDDFLPALQSLAMLQPEPTTPGSDEIVMVRTPSWDSIRLCRSNSGSQTASSPDLKRQVSPETDDDNAVDIFGDCRKVRR